MDGEAAEPAEGSLPRDGVVAAPLFTRVYIPLLLWHALGLNRLTPVGGPTFARRVPAKGPKTRLSCRLSKHIIVKTFNNGSLGSGIDEERSEMR